MGIYSLGGGLIGADIAMWPSAENASLVIPVTLGVIAGFVIGVLIVWYVRESEGTL
jgi:high-affinity Fe2+/Pb2+ permease